MSCSFVARHAQLKFKHGRSPFFCEQRTPGLVRLGRGSLLVRPCIMRMHDICSATAEPYHLPAKNPWSRPIRARFFTGSSRSTCRLDIYFVTAEPYHLPAKNPGSRPVKGRFIAQSTLIHTPSRSLLTLCEYKRTIFLDRQKHGGTNGQLEKGN